MKKISSNRILTILLALAAVLSTPALTQSKDQGTRQVGKVSTPSNIAKGKAFTPRMASLIRQYRGMAASAGLWRRTGFKVVKRPSIQPSTARPVAHNAKASGQGSGDGDSTSDVTYTITTTASDVENANGSRSISQTIVTKGSDGSLFTDTMTHTDDGNGLVIETQTVSATDAGGKTTTESRTNDNSLDAAGNTTTPGQGGGPSDQGLWCWGYVCAEHRDCCSYCPKSSPQCGDLK